MIAIVLTVVRNAAFSSVLQRVAGRVGTALSIGMVTVLVACAQSNTPLPLSVPIASSVQQAQASAPPGPTSAIYRASPSAVPINSRPNPASPLPPRGTPRGIPTRAPLPTDYQPGWSLLFVDDFNVDVSLGSWPGSYADRWLEYPDNTPDSNGRNRGSPSRWWPSKVVSVHDGLLDFYFHTEDGVALSAAVLPAAGGKALNQVYGRYVVRFRADSSLGYKAAFLLWPKSERWPQDGEIDFPEGDLAETIFAAMHRQDGKTIDDQDLFRTTIPFSGWHTAVIDWTPQGVSFILDGVVIGTSTRSIPNTPMHYVLQTEACEVRCPSPDLEGHLEVDWVAIYALVP